MDMEIETFINIATKVASEGVPLWMNIANIIIGLGFAALAGWMIWIYFDNKEVWKQQRPDFDRRSSGSFRGYWERYRAFIVNFMAAVFILLSIAFVAIGALNMEINNDIVAYLI